MFTVVFLELQTLAINYQGPIITDEDLALF